mgnify:CR=1 FL=1
MNENNQSKLDHVSDLPKTTLGVKVSKIGKYIYIGWATLAFLVLLLSIFSDDFFYLILFIMLPTLAIKWFKFNRGRVINKQFSISRVVSLVIVIILLALMFTSFYIIGGLRG